jgi:hypothetical protein
LQHIAHQLDPCEALAQIVMQVLTDAPLFVLADGEDLLLKPLAFGDVARYGRGANYPVFAVSDGTDRQGYMNFLPILSTELVMAAAPLALVIPLT